MKRSTSALATALLVLAPTIPTWSAEQEDQETSSGARWGLGAAFGLREQPYTDIDSQNIPVPILIFDNRWISFNTGTLDFKLPTAGPVSFALRAEYSVDGYEASDSPALVGMADRDDGFWLGGTVSWRNPLVDVSAEWMTDASDNSGGQRVSLSLQRGFDYGKFEFRPRLSATWLSDDYVDYYYGVTAAEALPSRAAYVGDSAVNFSAGLRTTWRFKPQQSLFLDLRVETLDNVIQDSPIVDVSTQPSLFIGYVYMFSGGAPREVRR